MPHSHHVRPSEKQQARELSERSGITFPAALRVVRGEATLDQVLKLLLRQEIRKNLESRGLPPALAGQVASGHLPETKAWETYRAMQHPAYAPEHSACFVAQATQQPVWIERFGEGSGPWTVAGVDKYDILLAGAEGGEPVKIQKHEIKWLAALESVEEIRRQLSVDPEVAALGLTASSQMQDRLVLPRAIALDLLDRSGLVRCTTRQGDVLVGKLSWISRYEIGLRLAGTPEEAPEVTLFLHALLRIDNPQRGNLLIDREAQARATVAPPKPTPPAPPSSKAKPGQKHKLGRQPAAPPPKKAKNQQQAVQQKKGPRIVVKPPAGKKGGKAGKGGKRGR